MLTLLMDFEAEPKNPSIEALMRWRSAVRSVKNPPQKVPYGRGCRETYGSGADESRADESRADESRADEAQNPGNGRDSLTKKMYEYFNSLTGYILGGLIEINYEKFEANYEKFEALMRSPEFMLIAFTLYKPHNLISLKSSEGVVYNMNKAAATTQSVVLGGLIEDTEGRGEIPLQVSGETLSKVIAFCEKQHDFHNLSNILADGHKDWVTDFLDTNWSILPDLYQAADFLNIPSLLNLTSLIFCRHRSKLGWESDPEPGPERELELKARDDFAKYFRTFESDYNRLVRVIPYNKRAAISRLHRGAKLADILGSTSLSGLSSQTVEDIMEWTLGDIAECFAKLTFD